MYKVCSNFNIRLAAFVSYITIISSVATLSRLSNPELLLEIIQPLTELLFPCSASFLHYPYFYPLYNFVRKCLFLSIRQPPLLAGTRQPRDSTAPT
jgi:hypothetical protein